MKQIKLAISGKANSGKSTVAQLFGEILGQHKIVAIADPMKHIVKTMFPEAIDKCLFGPSELRSEIISNKYLDVNGNVLTHRQALLDLGAFGRRFNNDIWLNYLVNDAEKSKSVKTYIVNDVRFVNEFNYLKKSEFTMIRILRNDSAKINDPSELEQESIPNSYFNHILYNNDSIDILNKQVKLIACKLLV